ncbi:MULTISPECIES: MipA/OmpV family protein [Psychrilyobacter]|uniref:MipA/OmpV family protein n=1 Tax=Psychrilyobacter piezotolerans TaxID=2293438 RepID=A0ABX9KH62_9FUSO|nr:MULTISPECIES: MipA/OmpV family protein [Psychrilyobacter]MCS5420328.1 MipA/OmpV family protein [Psychrilyobacter sp. S5]NDI78090.1 MipA/OmpV family protein [Psychrilyobacter piezotolerans]RDE61679.1 MipA/OmpV family protein [Psychrilyobacter sp. S5]REI41071.1 MipA/OmpV family protein [Psychrilyobacter piezotolerans]
MKKLKFIILIFFISIKSFSIYFLDPAINRIMIYIDKDGANNYAFIRGIAEEKERKKEKFISLGLAGSAIEPRFNDTSSYSTVVPLINVKYNNFYTFGGIYNGYNFYQGDKLALNFNAEYRFAGHTEDKFDSYLKELSDENNPIMLGIGSNYPVGHVLLTGGIKHNVRGNSDENTASIGVLGGIPFKKFIILGFLSYEMMSNSYTNRYFGISASDSGIPPHNIDGFGSAIRFTTVLAYSLSRNMDLFSYYYIESLSDNIKKSPLVKGSNSNMIGLGATYTF